MTSPAPDHDRRSRPLVEISVDMGGKDRALMIERANGRTTVPQIFIRGEHVGGCSELYRLDDDGRLDQLLKT